MAAHVNEEYVVLYIHTLCDFLQCAFDAGDGCQWDFLDGLSGIDECDGFSLCMERFIEVVLDKLNFTSKHSL